MSTLREFASANQAAPACTTCSLPADVLRQMTDAYGERVDGRCRRGHDVSFSAMSRWLEAEGHKVSDTQIRDHFYRGHHRR